MCMPIILLCVCVCENINPLGLDSDLAAILLLVHVLPPTAKGKRHGKISTSEAADLKFMKICC